ncbi:MAG: MBL fold metallo-hydrolase [Candidatus Saccharimonadales bacterium]
MTIEVISTSSLGNRGYLIHDGTRAVAVDVQRDYQRWIDAAKAASVTIVSVFETHMHNDYVTGGFRLAEITNTNYVVPAKSGESFSATEASDGQEFVIGELTVTALHTPGHTPHHMSYLVASAGERVICTGGGLLYGTVGRTDLVDPKLTETLTHDQYNSAQKLLSTVPDDTAVLPTHGFGSFCSSSDGSGATSSTLADEKKINIVFTSDSKQSFIDTIIRGLGPYPRYYAQMGPLNRAGPVDPKTLHIHDFDSDILSQQLRADNRWVVDIRDRKAFAAGHPEAAMGIELGNSFSTYTGWVLPWAQDIILVGDSDDSLREAHLELSRIGLDAFISGATSNLTSYFGSAEVRSYEIRQFSDLQAARQVHPEPFVLDVRLASDWSVSHVEGSVNIPLHEVRQRANELPLDQPIWVHCASGYRASIAASLIERSKRTPILINDHFDSAIKLGLTT